MQTSNYLSLSVDEEGNVVLTKTKFNIQIKNKYDCISCPICLNDFSNDAKQELIFLDCGHKYCSSCLEAHRKQNRFDLYVCPVCKFPNSKGFLVNVDNNIKKHLEMKNNEAFNTTLKCEKCAKQITTKKKVKCDECGVSYHGYCLKNYSDKMNNAIFLCPKCLIAKFREEEFICELCNEYKTKRRQNMERHKLQCLKYKCDHCQKSFKSKILLKSHQKEVGKLDKMNKVLAFMTNKENKSLEVLLNIMDLEKENRNGREEEENEFMSKD